MDNPSNQNLLNKKTWKATREGYGGALLELGNKNPNIVILTADLTESTRSQAFKNKYPERFFQFGVAEQNMMSAAAGMSLCGLIPFVNTYGVFSSGRCWDQLRVSVCYSNCNVKIEGAHAGLMVGPDGASHQALEDIALTSVLPNLTVISPVDSMEARKATIAAANIRGPVYLRLSREPTPILTDESTPFNIGKANIIKNGKDVAVIATGSEVFLSLIAANELENENISVCVINMHTIKPLDEKLLMQTAKKTGAIVTAEEHQIHGGLGSAVAEVLAQNYPVPMEMIGVRDSFGESGEPWELIEHFGLGVKSIKKAIKKVLKNKKL
ncbi:MAG: transketolase family protein [Actinobacteria bacterium]|nr:transketolase family protein [Actinomycetota bacterium]